MTAPHGTRTRYNVGCSCDACREAHREGLARRTRARVAWVLVNGLPDGIKHGISAYMNWGCRCDICTAANSAKSRARRERNSR